MFSKNGLQNFRVESSEGFSTPEGALGYANICALLAGFEGLSSCSLNFVGNVRTASNLRVAIMLI